jgi:hypothetical protein
MSQSANKACKAERDARKRRLQVWFSAVDAVFGCTAAGAFFSFWLVQRAVSDLLLALGFFGGGLIGAYLCAREADRALVRSYNSDA